MRLLPLLLLVSCAGAPVVEQQLIDCGAANVAPLIQQEEAIVLQDLSTGTWNAQQFLDTALTDSGPIVVCAVQAVITDIDSSAGTTPLPADTEVKYIAALSWLNSEGHAALVKAQLKAVQR